LLQGGTEIAVIAASVIIGLLILWIIVSIPVWIAAKILTAGRVKFTRAMLVTVGDPSVPLIIGFIFAFVAWIGIFKIGFDTGWLRALGIAILAIIVFVVIGLIISFLIQLVVPEAPPITPITPIPLQQV
jgi:hypothetical protein